MRLQATANVSEMKSYSSHCNSNIFETLLKSIPAVSPTADIANIECQSATIAMETGRISRPEPDIIGANHTLVCARELSTFVFLESRCLEYA